MATTSTEQDVILAFVGLSPAGCEAQDLINFAAGNHDIVRDKVLADCYSLGQKNLLTWNGSVIEPWTVLLRKTDQ